MNALLLSLLLAYTAPAAKADRYACTDRNHQLCSDEINAALAEIQRLGAAIAAIQAGSGQGAPSVVSFSPATGTPGATVTVTGANLGGASAAFFNGVQAPSVTAVPGSSSQVTTIVPTGATTGHICITTAAGSGCSATDFTVSPIVAPPTITAFLASPETITQGNASTLTIATTGATSCSVNQGVGAVPCNGTRSVAPSSSTTYTLTASNSACTDGVDCPTVSLTVTVGEPDCTIASATNAGISVYTSSTGQLPATTVTTTPTGCTLDTSGVFSAATGGSVTSGGLYTAPATAGTYSVTWTSNLATGSCGGNTPCRISVPITVSASPTQQDIAQSAGSPFVATKSSLTTPITVSVTAPAGACLVATLGFYVNSNPEATAPVGEVAGGCDGTWTQRVNTYPTSDRANQWSAQVWTCKTTASQTAQTVSYTPANTADSGAALLSVYSLTNADCTTMGATASALGLGTNAANTVNITPQSVGSFMVMADYFYAYAGDPIPTFTAGWTLDNYYQVPTKTKSGFTLSYKTTATTPLAVGSNRTDIRWAIAALEIKPAGGGAPPSGTVNTIYVATTGNDTTGDGTIGNPYATPGRAQTAARAIIAAGLPADGLTILLRGGVYPITSTLAFTAADSGAAGQLVTWKAYPGETVRISGGVAVGSWTQMSAASPDSPVTGAWNRTATATRTGGTGGGSQIWWATIPGTWSLGSMSDWNHAYGSAQASPTIATFSYAGVGQPIAQYPKRTAWNAKQNQWGSGSAGTSSINYTGTTEPTDRSWSVAAALPAADRPWVTVLDDSSGYTTGIRSVSGVSAGVLTLASYSGGSVNVGTNARWQVSNLLEEVTTAGEYWIDRANRVVYFLSPESGYASPEADARVSQLQTPLATFASAHHMMFDGIIWEDAQKDAIEFDPGVGSSKANATTAPSHDITIKNGKIRNTGGSGVLVRGTSHVLDHLQIYSLGASGVIFLAAANNSYYDPTNTSIDYLSRTSTLSNSEVYDTGWYVGPSDDGHAAVLLGGYGNLVTHCYFHDNRDSAIKVLSRYEAVTYNRFLRNALERADGGVLYQCRFPNANLEIGYNIWAFLPVSSVGSGGVYATYADDGTAGWNVHHNIYFTIGPATYGGGDGYSSGGSIGALVIKGASTFTYNVFSKVKYARYYGSPSGSGSTWSQNQGDVTSPATNLQNSGATDWANPPSQSGETWTGTGANAQSAANFLSTDPYNSAFLTNNADGTFHMAAGAGGGIIPVNQIGIQP